MINESIVKLEHFHPFMPVYHPSIGVKGLLDPTQLLLGKGQVDPRQIARLL